MTGLHLAQYRIDAELGRGGMGIVYKATDTKLNRTVALKVLPAAALTSDDDRARFFREAQAAAQLSHPNVCHVYQVDEAVPVSSEGETVSGQDEKRPFIAMEFIEGQTLQEVIKAGPIRLQDVVSIAGQVAEALRAAHGKEVVHRDIKSANVMLTSEGVAKVLDFGLAKTNASTMLTRMGSTLGTVAYMSPEQARGQQVDSRTDLYSLGTVMYEMLAGRLPFAGDYEQAVLYGILNETPDPLTSLRTGLPMQLEWIVNKLLSKEAEYRYQTAADLLADLKSLDLAGSGSSRRSVAAISSATLPTAKTVASRLPLWIWGAFAGVLVVGLAAGWFVGTPGSQAPRPVIKSQLELPDSYSPLDAVITPDDRFLYYSALDAESGRRQLAVYDFATGEHNTLPRTFGARTPAVSPDGRWVAFQSIETNVWWRIPISGGEPIEIRGAVSSGRSFAAFTENGDFIVSDTSYSIIRVGSSGEVSVVAERATSDVLAGAVSSPSGKFITWSQWPTATPSSAWILRNGADQPEKLLDNAWIHTITASGHALVIRDNINQAQQTVAIPINPETGDIEGDGVALGLRSAPMAVSPSGLLVYEELSDASGGSVPSALYRISDTGREEFVLTLPGVSSSEFAISGNGSRLAVNSVAEIGGQPDVFLVDLDLGTSTRLTQGGQYDVPTWGAEDEYLYFDHLPPGGDAKWVLMRRRADGFGSNELALPDNLDGGDPDLTPDGSLLVYRDADDDLWGYDTVGDSVYAILRDGASRMAKPKASPDGRYVAYVRGTDWCGTVQVTGVPSAGEPLEVAAAGCHPVWTAGGRYLYYEQRGTIYRVPVTTDPVFRTLGPAEVVYTGPIRSPGSEGGLYFDVATDGTLYVSYAPLGAEDAGRIWVVSNWFEELNRIAPRAH